MEIGSVSSSLSAQASRPVRSDPGAQAQSEASAIRETENAERSPDKESGEGKGSKVDIVA